MSHDRKKRSDSRRPRSQTLQPKVRDPHADQGEELLPARVKVTKAYKETAAVGCSYLINHL